MTNNREDVKEALCRRNRGACGLRSTTERAKPSAITASGVLERMEFPDPVIEVAIETKTKADPKSSECRSIASHRGFPPSAVSTDLDYGKTSSKAGELNLEIRSTFSSALTKRATVGAPQGPIARRCPGRTVDYHAQEAGPAARSQYWR